MWSYTSLKTDLASVSLLPASHPREDVRSLLLVFFRFDDISWVSSSRDWTHGVMFTTMIKIEIPFWQSLPFSSLSSNSTTHTETILMDDYADYSDGCELVRHAVGFHSSWTFNLYRGNNKLLSSWKTNKGDKRSCASICVTLFCSAAVLTGRVIKRPRRTFQFERFIVTCLATWGVVQMEQFQNLCWFVTQDDSDLLVAEDVSRTDEWFWRRLVSQTCSEVQLTPQTRTRTRTRRRTRRTRTRRETRQSCSR